MTNANTQKCRAMAFIAGFSERDMEADEIIDGFRLLLRQDMVSQLPPDMQHIAMFLLMAGTIHATGAY